MKVAVIGSRDFPRLDEVVRFVDLLPLDTVLISGGARGVDSAAEKRAIERGFAEVRSFRVQQTHWSPDSFDVQLHKWCDGEYQFYIEAEIGFETFAEAAFWRNGRIVDEGERVVAFWDGESHGTLDGIQKAGEKAVVVRA